MKCKDSIRQDKKSECKYNPTEGKKCIRVNIGDNEEIKLCFGIKCVPKKKSQKRIIEKMCRKKEYVSLPIHKTIVCMCDTDDKESGKSSDECVCEESSSSEDGSSCNCVCIPCEGEENVCVGLNVQGKIEACDNCKCGQEETTPEACDNKKCDKKNCICISTRGKKFICVGIDKKGTIMCYSDCTCEDDCKQGTSKSKPVSISIPGKSCVCVCLNDNRKVTSCFDCSCKEDDNKEKNCDGCCCALQESLPVLAFMDDNSVEVRKAVLEDKSTNTSCADCLCEIPKCTSFNCVCPPETPTVTIVKKFNDIGESHDCNCPEPKGAELPKCCKR